MILAQTLARSHARRRAVKKPQFEGFVTDLIGSGLVASERCDEATPQAFLVEQPPHWKLQTHFHQRDQFQVVIRGGGTLGQHAVRPLAVHYASAHSGYGPLLAGDEGLWYLTLRVVSDTGAWYLPDAREHLKLRIPKQQLHAAPSAAVDAAGLRTLAQPEQETLIAPDAGGLAAWMLRLPAEARRDAPAGAQSGGGRFHVLTQGSLRVADDELEGLAIAYAGPGDTFALHAGPAGAEVLVLQFPAAALRPVPEPAQP